ncbi:type II toxin-antitoxin system Phd/YefM family antitoxin [Opitutaceae bacterium TAV4]|uniref:type II toxin-antitoxin system Phd/YefM family antitoxin n=1 Tax=Geminisphaera colitermitum TaxID=1148786 RepID=UPI0001964F15|nr:type II toxin-antitoxin system prevent-host-death family antitoxin [Geminisphaera colitermitum]RRJ97505.1 type II toxin-antitoxin system Phd/YefM family antitoxin [Opitutaceae bacterium TAV4]RRK01882.1 type II toxin-antitoxin system Phd/YefM family antitoxin [Opitutaceae bacterium TAV3]
MQTTYSVTEAQANLPRIMKQAEDEIVTIERHGKVTAYVLGRERMEAIVETMELLASQDFMRTLKKYRAGTLKMKPLSAANV